MYQHLAAMSKTRSEQGVSCTFLQCSEKKFPCVCGEIQSTTLNAN